MAQGFNARLFAAAAANMPSLERVIELYTLAVLRAHEGNISAAQRTLDVSRKRIYRIMKRRTRRGERRRDLETDAPEVAA